MKISRRQPKPCEPKPIEKPVEVAEKPKKVGKK